MAFSIPFFFSSVRFRLLFLLFSYFSSLSLFRFLPIFFSLLVLPDSLSSPSLLASLFRLPLYHHLRPPSRPSFVFLSLFRCLSNRLLPPSRPSVVFLSLFLSPSLREASFYQDSLSCSISRPASPRRNQLQWWASCGVRRADVVLQPPSICAMRPSFRMGRRKTPRNPSSPENLPSGWTEVRFHAPLLRQKTFLQDRQT